MYEKDAADDLFVDNSIDCICGHYALHGRSSNPGTGYLVRPASASVWDRYWHACVHCLRADVYKRQLFLHGCPDKTLTISALGEQDFHYINMYYENDRPLLFSHKLKNPERTFSILEQILKIHPDADIRSQYQQEKLTEEFFAQIFADFQPEETYNESQIMSILLDFIAAVSYTHLDVYKRQW